MKKVTSLIMAILMGVSLTACGRSSSLAETISTVSESSQTEEKAEVSDTAGETAGSEKTQESQESASDSGQTPESGSKRKILVAYFSATGTTKGVAQEISSALGADLYEMIPEEPYSDKDLNYNDDNSRSTIEMKNPSARPAISGSVENMKQYDLIFLGYPIWWGEAPRIVSTFVESYDFSGKTIVPFCTSGGSDISSSASNLEKMTNGASWISGKRFSRNSSHEEIADWLNGLGLDLTAE